VFQTGLPLILGYCAYSQVESNIDSQITNPVLTSKVESNVKSQVTSRILNEMLAHHRHIMRPSA